MDSSAPATELSASLEINGDDQGLDTTGPLMTANPAPAQPLSKNAQKRLLKEQRRAQHKLEKKAREKAAKAEKRKKRAEELSQEDPESRAAKKQKSEDGSSKPVVERPREAPFGAIVVVDLGFDDKMLVKEIHSLCNQLTYTYSANRKAQRSFSCILFTSLNGRTKEYLDSTGGTYVRWKGVQWWRESYEHLWDAPIVPFVPSDGTPALTCSREKVVYLSGDAEEELTELKEDEVYIIGGLCDKNRYKNICRNKAEEQSIRTARLPIGRYIAEMTTRKILTVNQVFEILVKWVNCRDWKQALEEVLPKRKFKNKNKTKGKEAQEAEEESTDEPEDINENDATERTIGTSLEVSTR
jgi:tRNA (guanine9-N1)-methyltransferase